MKPNEEIKTLGDASRCGSTDRLSENPNSNASQVDKLFLIGTMVLVVCFVLGALIFGCLQNPRAEPLREYHQVGKFELIERSGRAVSEADLRGKIVVVDFFFGGCAEQCLTLSRQMAELQQLTTDLPGVLLVSITVDPGSDTPQALTRYASRINADTNRWLFLTGDKRIIYPLIQQSFLLAVAEEEDQTPSLNPGFIHSNKIALVDRRGMVRAYYDGLSSSAPQMILSGINEIMREKSSLR